MLCRKSISHQGLLHGSVSGFASVQQYEKQYGRLAARFVLNSMLSLGVESIKELPSWKEVGGQQLFTAKLDYLHFQLMSLSLRYCLPQNLN